MNDIKQPNIHSASDRASRRRQRSGWRAIVRRGWVATTSWLGGHKKFMASFLIVGLLVAAGYGLYQLGYQQGQTAQKKVDEKLLAVSRENPLQALQNRFSTSLAGKVEAISDTEISIKLTKGETKKLVIDNETTITNSKNAQIAVKDVKKGETVSVIGQNKDGKIFARRIRIVVPPSPTSTVTPKR